MSYRSPIFEKYGVFEATGPDTGVAAHYGEPLKEQRRLVMGGDKHAVVDYSHLDLVTVTGPDRLSWLTTLSSQVLDDMGAGDSRELLLLSPQGRIDYAPFALEDGERVWLIVERGQAQPLTDFLNSMKFMLRVEVADVSADFAAICSFADPARVQNVPEQLRSAPVWKDPWNRAAPGSISYADTGERSHPGEDFHRWVSLVERDQLLPLAEQVSLAGSWAAEALRIEAWRPRFATEVDERSIPHELDLMRTAVHLNKGCYKGQETVARVHNLGYPPRRLVFLDLDGSEHTTPSAGSTVYAAGKKVGRLTSVAQHWEAGPIGLAVIKRGVDPNTQLHLVDDAAGADEKAAPRYAATQTVVVPPDAGQTVGRRHHSGFLRGR